MPAPSQPPPSEHIPGLPSKSIGGAAYLVGVVVLLALAVGLFVWKKNQPTTVVTAQSASVVASVPSASAPAAPVLMYAPPPPPKLDDEPDAGPAPVKGGPIAKGSAGPAGTAAPVGPCSAKCDGSMTGALNAALTGKAQTAQGCYRRALRTTDVSGSITVSVQISPTGSVCSASIANDTLHSPEIASCVLGRFQGQSFPPPSGGCAAVNIPIRFKSE